MAGPSPTSKDLLAVTGSNSSRSVVESLLRQPTQRPPTEKPRMFKVARSPLLDQLQTFLPEIQRSNQQLLSQSKDKLEELDIENTKDDSKVIEMNLLMGEMSGDGGNGEECAATSDGDTSDSDSDGDSALLGAVTEGNLRVSLESEPRGRGRRNLIQVVSEEQEEERSDGEVTVASTSSGER